MKCKHCSEELLDAKSFCSGCGSKVETEEASVKQKHCVDCGAVLDVGKDFCGECGSKVCATGGESRTSNPQNPPQPVNTESLANEVIKEFKFYRLGYKGRLGQGGYMGMKNYCTIATVGQSTLKLLVCRGFTVGKEPVKPQIKELTYSEISFINLKKKISYGWLVIGIFSGSLGIVNPLYFIITILSVFQMFGRKVTIKLRYEDPFVILTESTKEADEFVKMVVNELKKQ